MQGMRQQRPNEQHPQNQEDEDSLTLKTDSSVTRQNTSASALKRHYCVTALKAAYVRNTIHFCYGSS